MTEDQAFIEWKAEQYKHQSTEEELEFVEHLHNFPRYFKKTFLDGYHEGFKECAKSKLNVTTISDCPIKDEWHYVKDGDLPKENNKDCLVLFHNKYSDNIVKDISRYSVKLKKWWFIHDLKDMEEEVIAWKEIVLPELKEIE